MKIRQIRKYRKTNKLTLAAFGDLVGVTKECVRRWESGIAAVGPTSAVRIEQATEGEIQLHELRPDLWRPPPERLAS